ncbi:spore germination protein [Peribacillus sp. NPDC056705]|uniref:spore germination protein n=1 Tax=Peribacillus sp. NPDC056705 TaxID=3345918 RepID=UPI003749F6C1
MVKQKEVISTLKEKFNDNRDLIVHQFEYYKKEIYLVYLESLSDEQKIRKDVIEPLLLCEKESRYLLHLLSLPTCKKVSTGDRLSSLLIDGYLLIFLGDAVYSYHIMKATNDQPQDATVEMSVLGPQKALSEDLSTNVNLIRTRYPALSLMVEQQSVGTVSKTPIAIMYDRDLVDHDVLGDLKKKIPELKMDMIQAIGELQNALTKNRHNLFPTMMDTQRPDRIALNLAQGKIAILLHGTPFGLIVPVVFFDFISAMDDTSHTFWVSRLMILIRYMGLIITLILPALYVALTSYNPEILRSQLAATIAGSRAGVPYPSFFEVIFMLLAVEMLIESSLRLPKTIGPTATTVGGLILGQAAQQAQLVSSIMIIITAFVAIANFTIPVNSMSFAVRVARYPLILLASFFGIMGLLAGIIIIVCYLTDTRSFGTPFLRMYWGSSKRIEKISDETKGERS